ncbi:MAG: inner membrane protein YpjD [Pseudomonas sp. PGPPP4]|uniref:cytochrome C assembly family protein n=1 Tax=Pseudomonas TaxID=286 RepID=UPI000BDCF5C8|nr:MULTISPECIES: cytochrome c biogenesis protein CcsA [Pseudomonas]MCI1011925.1 cytochrome c biogenesis protein CcsA [Pseudomonas oryzihabitans]OYT82601.1 MAG: inner membrane protein YpjD [Pseudomonas sp. PGPPP4]
MHALLPTLLAAALYLLATLYQGSCLLRKQPSSKPLVLGAGILALLPHALAVYLQLILEPTLSLDFFDASSLISATAIALMLIGCLRMPLQPLLVLVYPLGAITALLAEFVPPGTVTPLDVSPKIVVHVLLSIIAYGLFTLAVLQSCLVLLQNHQLKNKHPSGLIRSFPPLQTMESLLFGFLWAGWVVLSLALISGWFFVEDMFAQHLIHKTVLSCIAWVVFGILLWGRHRLGWRGHTAIRWTLLGFILLMLAYFGSKLVREFILHR